MSSLPTAPVVEKPKEPEAGLPSSESQRWQAVLDRDRRQDGAFVYAVRSTGVYCRPSCPSRKPARSQVVFFHLPEAAEAAGFRCCRRCLPRQQPFPDPRLKMVSQTCRTIMEDPAAAPSLARLAQQAGVNPYRLQRMFKEVMGLTPRQYADACRLKGLKVSLKSGQSITEALYEAGYGSSSRLYEPAYDRLGMTPGAYRRGGAGLSISYTLTTSPLGKLLIAATQKGVCAISLGEGEEALEEELRREFPGAEVRRDDPALATRAHAVLENLAGRLPSAEIPLDLRATAFQRLVWQELQRIPRGETRSYSQIARAIGRPRAARAVGQACRQNRVAVVIPCHRAVREGQELGGYRWGLARKQALLEQERDQAGEP